MSGTHKVIFLFNICQVAWKWRGCLACLGKKTSWILGMMTGIKHAVSFMKWGVPWLTVEISASSITCQTYTTSPCFPFECRCGSVGDLTPPLSLIQLPSQVTKELWGKLHDADIHIQLCFSIQTSRLQLNLKYVCSIQFLARASRSLVEMRTVR